MNYQIESKGNTLILRTTSFRAEAGSVLHSGIYNRELASSLASGAVLVAIGFFVGGGLKPAVVHFVAALFLFAALFVVFRLYVFHESMMETVFDKGKGLVTLTRTKVIGSEVKSYPLRELLDIKLGHVTVQPQNVDGIKFVEKIALQHGTVIPGLGKRQDFYTVQLDFADTKVVIFSSGEKHGAETVVDEIKRHIKLEASGAGA